MEFLAGLYTLLLVTICLLLALVLWQLNRPRKGGRQRGAETLDGAAAGRAGEGLCGKADGSGRAERRRHPFGQRCTADGGPEHERHPFRRGRTASSRS